VFGSVAKLSFRGLFTKINKLLFDHLPNFDGLGQKKWQLQIEIIFIQSILKV